MEWSINLTLIEVDSSIVIYCCLENCNFFAPSNLLNKKNIVDNSNVLSSILNNSKGNHVKELKKYRELKVISEKLGNFENENEVNLK
jgi:hypothetical protein